MPLSGALAADMPLKAPPAPPPPAYTWTGYYVGVNVGYGAGDDPTTMSTVSGAGLAGAEFYLRGRLSMASLALSRSIRTA